MREYLDLNVLSTEQGSLQTQTETEREKKKKKEEEEEEGASSSIPGEMRLSPVTNDCTYTSWGSR